MNVVDNLLREGITAVKAGQRAKARALLQRVLRERPNDVSTWLWLSGAVETDDERRECLEKVLEIDPDNPHAKKGLQKLPPRVAPPQEIPVSAQIAAEEPSTPPSVATEKSPTSPALPAERHRHLLEEEVKWYTSRGWQVVFQSGTAIQLRKGKELKYVTVEQIEQRIVEAQARASPGVAQRTKKHKKRLKGKLSGWQMAAAIVALILLCGCPFALFLAIGTSTPTNVSPPLGPGSIPKQTETPTPMKVLEWEGVYIGMPADDVLKIHPKSELTEDSVILGNDSEGLIVRWSYPGAYLTFALREGEGTDSLGLSKCYRIVEIQLR